MDILARQPADEWPVPSRRNIAAPTRTKKYAHSMCIWPFLTASEQVREPHTGERS